MLGVEVVCLLVWAVEVATYLAGRTAVLEVHLVLSLHLVEEGHLLLLSEVLVSLPERCALLHLVLLLWHEVSLVVATIPSVLHLLHFVPLWHEVALWSLGSILHEVLLLPVLVLVAIVVSSLIKVKLLVAGRLLHLHEVVGPCWGG